MSAVSLPPSVPFPVTVTAVFCRPGDIVQKYSTLIKYKYWDYQEDPNSKEENPPKIRVERIGTFESPFEGQVTDLTINVYDEIPHSGVVLCSIEEPCSHTVQYGGLCALCGKAVEDEKDYTGYNYEDRATISMAHDNTGLRISLDEAQKIEQNTTDRLAKDNKLILVVDLDQTVIHATVDPTVGDWQRDPQYPNYPFVKDVKPFCLEEEPMVPPGWMGPRPARTKCWYYVKLRPGLEDFLARVSKKYELHIYTMATRNYASAIASIIDPTGEYFGDRILSRDESGSLTHKNLKRLFPVDQSMVVIIDDRGDVWQWDPNLVKVVPYDFFVGIGDINSSFLPKKNGQLVGPTKKRKTLARLEAMEEDDTGGPPVVNSSENSNSEDNQDDESSKSRDEELSSSDREDESESEGGETNLSSRKNSTSEQDRDENSPNSDSNSDGSLNSNGDSQGKADETMDSESHESDLEASSPVDRMLELGGGENNKNLLLEQLLSRNQSLEQQQHDRPLAKLQNKVEEIVKHNGEGESDAESSKEEEEEHILYDDDTELITLEKALNHVHEQFYKAYRAYEKDHSLERPNLTIILPRLKQRCLEGVVILISGILPLGMNINNADIVIWCRQFGVKVVSEVYPEITHVVCRDPNSSYMKPGLTFKARVAKKTIPDVKIVNPDWLFACLSLWKKVDEEDYLIDVSKEDWYVSETDVEKYQQALDSQKERDEARVTAPGISTHRQSLSSINGYDFDEASAEVDDFLAGISDDDDDDDDDEAKDGDEDEAQGAAHNGGNSFIRGLYGKKRKVEEEESEEEEEEDRDENGPERKKAKNEDNMDELEKELLDELDQIAE